MEKVKVQQVAAHDLIQQLPPIVRFGMTIFVSALLAYYIPLIVPALTGQMLNQLSAAIDLVVHLSILIVLSLLGNHFNRIWHFTIAVAILILGYEINLGVRMVSSQSQWFEWAWRSALPLASLLLNAFFFSFGLRYMNLRPSPTHQQVAKAG